jgi:hypothetical protein
MLKKDLSRARNGIQGAGKGWVGFSKVEGVMKAKLALGSLVAGVLICGHTSASNAEPRKITEDEKTILRGGLSQILRRIWARKRCLAFMHGS